MALGMVLIHCQTQLRFLVPISVPWVPLPGGLTGCNGNAGSAGSSPRFSFPGQVLELLRGVQRGSEDRKRWLGRLRWALQNEETQQKFVRSAQACCGCYQGHIPRAVSLWLGGLCVALGGR